MSILRVACLHVGFFFIKEVGRPGGLVVLLALVLEFDSHRVVIF